MSQQHLMGSPYHGYVYAYPHKTAYRPLRPRPTLGQIWAGEARDALALYLHVPFCEVRCGFCNLFTRIGAPNGLTGAYLDAMERQADAVAEGLGGEASFATAAFGGGTPTFLTAAELDRLCDIAERRMGAPLGRIPLSVEASPSTATPDRLAVLAQRGGTRLSLGVQSFVDSEARAAVRPQKRAEVETALAAVRDARFPVLNIDLIYGIEGQTERTWRESLDAALAWRPEELYLYPLYVRPLTGLARLGDPPPGVDRDWDEQRLRLYRRGRDHLLERGYEQVSMRMFRLPGNTPTPSDRLAPEPGSETVTGPPKAAAPRSGDLAGGHPGSAGRSASDAGRVMDPSRQVGGPVYCCQSDGMVGLGCGSRSYTDKLHYSFDYAVDMRHIRLIIDDYVSRPAEEFRYAEVGRYIDAAESRRRYLMQSLLQAEGLDTAGYHRRFGSDPAEDFAADLAAFAKQGWLSTSAGPDRLRLSAEGLAHSDAVGPALFSPRVRAAMARYRHR